MSKSAGLSGLRARREGLLSSAAAPHPGHVVIVCAEKGGSGKTTSVELLSITLDDMGADHVVVECETSQRLERRIGGKVRHHRLQADDAKSLAAEPDALNLYWDRALAMSGQGISVWDLAANSLELMLRWAVASSARAALADGARVTFALVMTSDAEAMGHTHSSIRQIQYALPMAEVWVILNEHEGAIDLGHRGVAAVLEGVARERILTLPNCRAPRFSTLKNVAGFVQAVNIDVDALVQHHGIPPLQAGRAVEGLADWLLAACEVFAPLAGHIASR